MHSLVRALTSSIGKKIQVALAGLLLVGFLVSHLAGNMLLWLGAERFNQYAEMLESNPLLPIAEVILAGLFLLHIVVALYIRWENHNARPDAYQARAWAGGRTAGSATMMWTGLIVLVFLVIHVKTMRFEDHGGDLYRHVLAKFTSAPYAAFYVFAMIALGLHLSHGAQAALRTLGIEHPKYTPFIGKAGVAFAVLISGGFGALAVWAGWFPPKTDRPAIADDARPGQPPVDAPAAPKRKP